MFRNIFAAASTNHDELPALFHVGRRRRNYGEGECTLPQKLAATGLVGVEFLVMLGGTDKKNAACRDNRTAIVLRARNWNAFRCEFGVFPKRNLPKILARLKINCVQSAPWS
jgi:hypothetical protein